MSGAELSPGHCLPAVQPLCLQSPEIKGCKSGLTKGSGSGTQGAGGGSCCFQENRVGRAPRQGIAPLHQSGSHGNIWQNVTCMKKIVAEAKSRWNATPKQCDFSFSKTDLPYWISSCASCASSSGVSSALEISLYWDGALQPCVSLWVRCCSLILNKNQLLLCGLVISAINWLPQYLINLLRETSSSYVTFALPSVTESGILIKRRKKSNLEKTQPHLKQDPATRMNPCFVTTFLSGTFIYHTLLLFL